MFQSKGIMSLWDKDHSPNYMHETYVWKPISDIEEKETSTDEYDRDRVIQVHQNLNLARIAELSNSIAKSLRALVILGWLSLAVLILILLTQ